jgi:hypothetical protein
MLEKAYNDTVNAIANLVAKFEAYVKASNYDGKQDFNKWLGALAKATKELETALGTAKRCLAILEKAVDDYIKKYKDTITKDKAWLDMVTELLDNVAFFKTTIEEIEKHLNQFKT